MRSARRSPGVALIGCPSSDDLRQFAGFRKGGSAHFRSRCGMQVALASDDWRLLSFDPFVFEEMVGARPKTRPAQRQLPASNSSIGSGRVD